MASQLNISIAETLMISDSIDTFSAYFLSLLDAEIDNWRDRLRPISAIAFKRLIVYQGTPRQIN